MATRHMRQDENKQPGNTHKKSALPVPVRKMTRRKVLGALPSPVQVNTKQQKAVKHVVNSASTSQKSRERILSLVEEQKECGLEFEEDRSALKSILTDVGIAGAASAPRKSGTAGSALKPMRVRVTEGQGKRLHTPLQGRTSIYYQGPAMRMSLIDTCKSYQKQLRAAAGVEAETASPVLPKPPKSIYITESPLVKGAQSHSVPRSVYPQFSKPAVPVGVSPMLSTPGRIRPTAQGHSSLDAQDDKSSKPCYNAALSTPVTPFGVYGRVPRTPCSITAQRVRSAVTVDSYVKTATPFSQSQRTVKKKLRWADILSSPELPLSICTTETDEGASTRSASETSTTTTTEDRTAWTWRGQQAAREKRAAGPGQWQTTPHGSPPSARATLAGGSAVVDVDDGGDSSRRAVPCVTQPAWSQPQQQQQQLELQQLQLPEPPRRGPHGSRQHGGGGGGYADTRSSTDTGRQQSTGFQSLSKSQSLSLSLSLSHPAPPPGVTVAPSARGVTGQERGVVTQGRGGVPPLPADGGARAPGDEGRLYTGVTSLSSSLSGGGDGAVVAVGCGAGDGVVPSASVTARLQALETEERRIQHEMQLLKMAMQREQEGDGNGNHVSNTGATTTTTTTTAPAHTTSVSDATHQYHSCPPASRPTFTGSSCHITRDSAAWGLSQTTGQSSFITSSSTCNDIFYSKSQKSADHASDSSTSSSSASLSDVNSNILTIDTCETQSAGEFFSTSHFRSNVLSFMCTSDTNPHAGAGSSRDDGDGHETRGEVARLAQVFQHGAEAFERHSNIPAQGPTVGSVVIDINDNVNSSQAHKTEPRDRTRSEVNNLSNTDADAQMDFEDFTAVTREHTLPRETHTGNHAGCGPASDDGVCNGLPTPMLVHPFAVSPPNSFSPDFEVNPPIWTTLALRSAASSCLGSSASHTSSALSSQSTSSSGPLSQSRTQHQQTTRSNCFPSGQNKSGTTPDEVEAVAAAVTRSVSLSPRPAQRISPTKHIAARLAAGGRNRSMSPARRNRKPPNLAKRSPMRAKLRQGQGERRGVALRDPDIFLEALLEDECALYAGRLQSFFRQMEMSCDRKDLPDPVARILTEGDDMHFVPICEETGQRRALEGSAFSCYTPA